MRCAGCSRMIPSDAAFCMYCATPIGEATAAPTVQPRPATGPTMRLQPADARRAMRSSPPVVVTKPSTPPRRHAQQPPAKRHKHHDASTGIFLLGLGVLWLTSTWWPGIVVLLAITSFLKHESRGHVNRGLSNLVFWIGLVALWYTPFFWPGLIVLMIVSHHIGKQRQPVGKQQRPVTWI